jgi:alkylation response protein AidB-like acyl-CoA dehydrogenase
MDRETNVVAAVRRFVDDEVRPAAAALEQADLYPHALVDAMRALGLFGALVPREYGGLGLDVTTYARVIEELCRGWMSLAGVVNSHTLAALIVLHHGTDAQRRRLLPRFASGEARGGLCLTEPHAGSDVQAIRTRAVARGDSYLVSGTKMFVTNGREGNTFALLAVTDPRAQPRHRGMSCFIVEKGASGLSVVKSIGKLGYKGVDTAELVFEEFPCPADNLVGGVEGRGFGQVMSGLEAGRINIAARAVGVAQAALEETAARREGHPRLLDMAARVDAARLLTYWAAAMKDRAERCDLEAGMAKLFASETAHEVALDAVRLCGTSTALAIERCYRDTPLMIIGEGTNEIQRTLIARQLVDRHGERGGALVSREAEPEERRHMLLAVRQVAEKNVAPVAADHDRAGHVPDEMVAQLADLGVFAALVPASHGGLGLDLPGWAMLIEELARAWAAPALLAVEQGAVAYALGLAGGDTARHLPALGRAEALAAVVPVPSALTRRDGGECALDGDTPPIANAARATLLALTLSDGTAWWLVPASMEGVAVSAVAPDLGLRGAPPAVVSLRGVRLPISRPSSSAPRLAAVSELGVGAIAVGLGQAAFEAALRYSQQRTTFGQPLCQHQAVQLKLADMATGITAARLLTYRAAEDDARDPDAGAMARLAAARVAADATLESMRIHGGYGYVSEFPVERFYRDAARLSFVPLDDDTLRREVAARLAGRA